MRLTFSIPDEPSSELYEMTLKDPKMLPDRIKDALFDYFCSVDRPQTYILPRNLVRRTVDECVSHYMEILEKFPKFSLDTNRPKFVRCCYGSIWRTLLLEWKSRLILATGRTAADSELPSGFDPWLDLSSSDEPVFK